MESVVSVGAAKAAFEIVFGSDRGYGEPLDCARRVAERWSGVMGLLGEITPADQAGMMSLLKVERERVRHNPDNLVDMYGYQMIEIASMLGSNCEAVSGRLTCLSDRLSDPDLTIPLLGDYYAKLESNALRVPHLNAYVYTHPAWCHGAGKVVKVVELQLLGSVTTTSEIVLQAISSERGWTYPLCKSLWASHDGVFQQADTLVSRMHREGRL